MATLFGCSDDVQYTEDSQARISFSVDTIAFDTVFTTIGSSTKYLHVYNDNKKAVRLSSVRLASGGKSGFRVNVDGQYGTTFSDIDILKEDSLFVFVEVTVNPFDSDSPVLVRDSLQFTLANGHTQQVILQAYGQDVIILRGETFSVDTTLDANRPYLIYDSLVVAPNATLNISKGTTLCLHSGASIHVHGRINAAGTVENPVIFRGDRTDNMFDYLPYDRLDGQWGGIHIYPESDQNMFDHVDIHSGSYGICCDWSTTENVKVSVYNSEIHNVAGNGIELNLCSADIVNTQITNAKGNCVDMTGGAATFLHCTLGQFYPWNSDRGHALQIYNAKNDTIYPLYQCDFYNSIVTGYADDEIYASRYSGEYADSIPFNLHFESCLVNTDTVGASQYFTNCILDNNDSTAVRATQFKLIDTDIYLYNFQLDSLSTARGIANPVYSTLYAIDKNGVTRKTDHPDAGCYEYNF